VNVKKQLGAKIKRLRSKYDLTQEQLAEKIQVATRTLCGIENGENFVKAETIERLCNVLNITLSELFACDHLKPQEDLINEIIIDLKQFKNREKIETIYKFVKSLKVE